MKNIQDAFLSRLQAERQTVTSIITNGFQARGQITGHDRYTAARTGKDGQQLTYRHAIATIVPETPGERKEAGQS